MLNLNSRSRSNCGGCKACIHNYHDFYDGSVIKDKRQIVTTDDMKNFFKDKKINVSELSQIAVVTGLFGGEEKVVDHMCKLNEVAKMLGFRGQLMYFGCEVNSQEALEKLASLGNFQLIYALDNFTKREVILSKRKSTISLEMAKNTLDRAKDLGIKTTISYICGLDDLNTLKNGFAYLCDSFSEFPIINIYQIQTDE